LISAFSAKAPADGCGEPGLGSLPAGAAYGNMSAEGSRAGWMGGATGVGVTDADGVGAACGAGSLMGAGAGISLANGLVYSRFGVITATEVGW
jgi:hypothetical protein